MSKRIPDGIDNFHKLIAENCLFVDKSLFVKDIIENDSDIILITRPRRWGKTLNMSMLHHFLSPEVNMHQTESLFDNLLITKEFPEFVAHHQGKYPAIFVTFKGVKGNSFENAIAQIRETIKALYLEYFYLTESSELNKYEKCELDKYLTGNVDQAELENSLLVLSKLLKKHHGENAYILIDEYDTPMNFAYGNYLDSLTVFMKTLLGNALKGNTYLQKGIMTGILYISKNNLLSDLNNLKEYTLLTDKTYQASFGFTEAEVDALFIETKLVKNSAAIKAWYNGYQIEETVLYNPFSIIRCLSNKGEIGPYWVNTASDKLLKTALLNASLEVKKEFEQLLVSENMSLISPVIVTDRVRYDDLSSSNNMALCSLLLASGYLKYMQKAPSGIYYDCLLAIPNQEVRTIYDSIFREWLKECLQETYYHPFLKALTEGNAQGLAQRLSDYLMACTSFFDFKNESNYHTFMLGLICSLKDTHYFYSNPEAGRGRADIMLVPKNTTKNLGIILEFKYTKADEDQTELAKKALAQIDIKSYDAFLKQYTYIDQVLKVGIAFLDKSVVIYDRLDDLHNHPLTEMESCSWSIDEAIE